MKSARIVQYLTSDAVRWQEDKYAPQLQYHNLKIMNVILKLYALAAILISNNVDEWNNLFI